MRTTRIIAFSIAMMAVPLTVLASDAPASRLAPVAHILAAAPAATWTGFYVGGQLGYSWGNLGVVGLPVDIGTDGYFGGARLGFDYQIPRSRFVAGLLADGNVGSVGGSTNAGGFSIPADADLNGSLRFRAGYAFDGFLLYATGGLSAVKHDVSVAGFSGSKTTFGWIAGAGIEAKLYEHWSIGLEYLYRGRTDDNLCLAPLACVPIKADAQEIVGFLNYRF